MDRSLALQEVEASRISKQSAIECGKAVSPRRYPWYSFLLEVESTTGPSAAGRITSPIANGTRDLAVCGAVRQPTAPPRAPE
jgi:hypothetical protein